MKAFFDTIHHSFSYCWMNYPALLYGLAAFFGACLALFDLSLIIASFICILFFLPLVSVSSSTPSLKLRLLLALSLGATTFFFNQHQYQFPVFEKDSLSGTASVTFSSMTHSKTSFGPVWSYKGILHTFRLENEAVPVARNLPIRLTMPAIESTAQPSTDHRYKVQGRLKKIDSGHYALTVKKNIKWEALKTTWTPGKWRYEAKRSIRDLIYHKIQNPHTAAFLAGIATGEFDDRQLSFELGRFGLQHLMAISGLHFGILASLIGCLLNWMFRSKHASFFSIVALSAYFLFLGASPSVFRAWIAITLTLTGTLFGKRSIALNSLGMALLLTTLLDPFAITTIGFQFSFGVSAAILLWFTPLEMLCQILFAKRELHEVAKMDLLNQHGYCLLYFFRQALALAIAVNLVALPLTLYHFHKFPWMSLVYNLFFPLLISVSMLLLLTALLTSVFFPWLAAHLHALNEGFTNFLLNIVFNLPKSFDISLRVHELHPETLSLYLFFVFGGGLLVKYTLEKEKGENAELIFT